MIREYLVLLEWINIEQILSREQELLAKVGNKMTSNF